MSFVIFSLPQPPPPLSSPRSGRVRRVVPPGMEGVDEYENEHFFDPQAVNVRRRRGGSSSSSDGVRTSLGGDCDDAGPCGVPTMLLDPPDLAPIVAMVGDGTAANEAIWVEAASDFDDGNGFRFAPGVRFQIVQIGPDGTAVGRLVRCGLEMLLV